jgi:hypothetical protein
MFFEGRDEEAISYMTSSLSKMAPDITSEYVLIDLLLRKHRIDDTIERLKMLMDIFPEEESINNYLEQLQAIARHRSV